MHKLNNIASLTLALLLSSCSANPALTHKNTYFEVKPFVKIETKDGINKKEANMILEMYRKITLGGVTLYYSEVQSEKQNWVSRKKGHWGYRVMKHPIFINKSTGSLDHGKTHYTLKQLIDISKQRQKTRMRT